MLRLLTLLIFMMTFSGVSLSDEIAFVDSPESKELSINKQYTFKNWGVGSFSCTQFVESREMPDSPIGPYDATFRQWLMGYATAFNIMDETTSDLLGRTSIERTMNWIENYCRLNGDVEFVSAVWKFTHMAYPHRMKTTVNTARN